MKKIQTEEDCRFRKHCESHGLLSKDSCVYKSEIEGEEAECKHYDSPIYKNKEAEPKGAK